MIFNNLIGLHPGTNQTLQQCLFFHYQVCFQWSNFWLLCHDLPETYLTSLSFVSEYDDAMPQRALAS